MQSCIQWSEYFVYHCRYGPHYWLVDIDMDCSKTINGWFEIKAINNHNWEHSLPDPNFATDTPYPTVNHWARCGAKNAFHFNS